MSFDLNDLKNSFAKYFENSVKSLHFFKGSMAFKLLIQIFLPDTCEVHLGIHQPIDKITTIVKG